jgi:tetratricopeptide (TPR) repeat protein
MDLATSVSIPQPGSDRDRSRRAGKAILYRAGAAIGVIGLCLVVALIHIRKEQHRGSAEKSLKLAIASLRQHHNLAQAQKLALSAVRTDPSYARAYFILGQIAEAQGDWDGAIKWLTEYQRLGPRSPGSQAVWKWQLQRLQTLKQADQTPHGRIQRHYYELIARAQTELGGHHFKEAVYEASLATRIDASRWEAYAVNAAAAMEQEQFALAESFLSQALQRASDARKPGLLLALKRCDSEQRAVELYGQGTNSLGDGNYTAAAEAFAEASALAPEHDEYMLAKTTADVGQNDRNAAAADLILLQQSQNPKSAAQARRLLADLDKVMANRTQWISAQQPSTHQEAAADSQTHHIAPHQRHAEMLPLASPGQRGWTPAGGGCFVWNESPRPDEAASWDGDCKDGRASGNGTLIWRAHGKLEGRYEGELKDGKQEGHGVEILANGARYDGEWKKGWMAGHGVFTYANGAHYDGEWKDGHKTGHGVETWANGERYDGEWKDGHKMGHGVETWANGARYDGEYTNDRPNGTGVYVAADGSTFGGIWQDGCFREDTPGGQRRAWIGRDATSSPCP